MGARWYEASSASFLSRDTVFGELSTPISLNRYTYAWANPNSFWDPDGHASTFIADGIYYGGTTTSNTSSSSSSSQPVDVETAFMTQTIKKTTTPSEKTVETVFVQEERQYAINFTSVSDSSRPSPSLFSYQWKPGGSRTTGAPRYSWLDAINPLAWPGIVGNHVSQSAVDVAYINATVGGWEELKPTAPVIEQSSYVDMTACFILCGGIYLQSRRDGSVEFGLSAGSIGTLGFSGDLGLRSGYPDEIASSGSGYVEGLVAEVVPGSAGA